MKMLKVTTVLVGVMLAFNLVAEDAANRMFTVEVQDSSRKPIAGATVDCYDFDDRSSEFTKPKSETTDTNGAAKVTFKGEWGYVVARKSGLATVCSHCGPMTPQPIVLNLTPPQSVSGTVVDEADKPVSDAKVSVNMIGSTLDNRGFSYEMIAFNPDIFSARTGLDGRFRIENLPANCKVDMVVKKRGKAQVFPARKYVGSDTMIGWAGQEDIELKMQPAGSVEGKVVMPEEGKKLPILIELESEPPQVGVPLPHTQPMPDGSFRFEDLTPSKYWVNATFGTNAFPDWVARCQILSVEAGQVVSDVKITAVKGGVLEVPTFSTWDHKPVGNVYVSLQDSAEGGQTGGKSGENGVLFVRLFPGRYRISGKKEGVQASEVFAEVEEGKTNRVELELTPPPQVAGTVRDTHGAPVAGIEVRLYPSESTARTDSKGYYEINGGLFWGMQGATPYVIVRDRGRNLAAAKNIEEGTDRYDLQLAPALVVSGRVMDEQGRPLTNALVNIVATGCRIDSEKPPKVDAQGRYEIAALPVGRRYRVDVSAKGYGSVCSKNEDIDTNRFEFTPITLRIADKKIAGVVVDSDNKPVRGVRTYTYGDGQPRAEGETDDKGHFAFNEVCDGIVIVGASAGGGARNVRVEAGDTNIVITMGQQGERAVSRPSRASLVGKPLPDLTAAGVFTQFFQTNKPMLVCLFDPEQRPSRRVIRLLADQKDALKQKGVIVVCISAALTTGDALKEWIELNPSPFTLGAVAEKNDQTQWILATEKFPWFILTDAQGRVKAEGFELDELEAKLKQQ